MSKLLLDESPILVLPSLATKIGLNEAIFIQQLHYWLKESTNVRDSHKWVYNTYEEWQEQFPFWSVSTIRRTITKLEKANLIIVDNFNKMAIDKTKWYRINYEMLESMNSPSVQNEQSKNSELKVETSDSESCKPMSSPSVQSEQSMCSKWTALDTKLNTPITIDYTEITTENKEKEEGACASGQSEIPFLFFENNGFGMISGYMSEKISAWCQDLSDDLVLEAMKLAVENGKKTWRYVETILRSWSDKGIKTVEQARADQNAFREQRSKQRNTKQSNFGPMKRQHTEETKKPVSKEERLAGMVKMKDTEGAIDKMSSEEKEDYFKRAEELKKQLEALDN